MVHSGYEATAVTDTVTHPLKALKVNLRGIKTDGKMAPEINLDGQRKAEYLFSQHVEIKLAEIGRAKSESATNAVLESSQN
jgi:hypothetical protein